MLSNFVYGSRRVLSACLFGMSRVLGLFVQLVALAAFLVACLPGVVSCGLGLASIFIDPRFDAVTRGEAVAKKTNVPKVFNPAQAAAETTWFRPARLAS